MDAIMTIGTIIGALAIGVVSPGPSFLLVAQTSVSLSRWHGLLTALGMGIGASMMALFALLGLHAILTSVPWLYLVLKVIGGLYLLYLAVNIWRGAGKPLAIAEGAGIKAKSGRKSFLLALGTMLGNPKAAIQYGVIFAALLPREVSTAFSAFLILSVFLLETGWYVTVALVLSSTRPRNIYLGFKAWIDRSAGCVMAVLGVRLLSSSRNIQ